MLRQETATSGLVPELPLVPAKGLLRRMQVPVLLALLATNEKSVQLGVVRQSVAQPWLVTTPVYEATASPAMSAP